MGPLLLARLLNLNDTQTGVLQLVFKIADDQGLLLLDLKDLRAMIQHVGENAKTFTTEYGNVSTASIGAIQRGLLTLEEQGGDLFFGEPMLDIHDLMKVDENGRGVINMLAADKLVQAPGALPPSCSGCSPNCSSNCRKPATSTSRSSFSSSTRRICYLPMRRRR
jgi:DNA helicase HerA-like ATPase